MLFGTTSRTNIPVEITLKRPVKYLSYLPYVIIASLLTAAVVILIQIIDVLRLYYGNYKLVGVVPAKRRRISREWFRTC